MAAKQYFEAPDYGVSVKRVREGRYTVPVARVTVNFPARVWSEVNRMADEQSISRTEALRRCISTEAFRRQVEAGLAELVIPNLSPAPEAGSLTGGPADPDGPAVTPAAAPPPAREGSGPAPGAPR